MRKLLAALIAMSVVLAVACGGDDDASTPTARATTAGTRPTAQATSPGNPTPSGGAQTPQPGNAEVTGVVGSVSAQSGIIEINRLSGADVSEVAVEPGTVIRRATGGTATINEIRPSDRIVASGRLTEGGEALIATEITIQDVTGGGSSG